MRKLNAGWILRHPQFLYERASGFESVAKPFPGKYPLRMFLVFGTWLRHAESDLSIVWEKFSPERLRKIFNTIAYRQRPGMIMACFVDQAGWVGRYQRAAVGFSHRDARSFGYHWTSETVWRRYFPMLSARDYSIDFFSRFFPKTVKGKYCYHDDRYFPRTQVAEIRQHLGITE